MYKINLEFQGYFWNTYDFPETNGVYCIYATFVGNDGKRNVGELLYVGKSNNIARRISEHAREDYIAREKYCYTFSELSSQQAKLAEAALVSECKPEGNTDFIDGYPEEYEAVEIYVGGKHKSIPDQIIK